MVAELIASWGQMQLPENCDIRCLIVENDEHPNTQPLIAAQPVLPNGAPLDYVLETEAGIPFGRNRAAKEAIARGDDLLVFVDDDETVAQDWLVSLITGYRESQAVLLGAPLRIAPRQGNLTAFQSLMYDNLRFSYEQRETRTTDTATLNSPGRAVIATNNWIAETGLFRDENIWFDESLRFSGGEDTRFQQDVKDRGFAIGWVKDAFAYETVPAQRLSFIYQYRRTRDQANTNFQRRLHEKPSSRYKIFLKLPGKALQILFLTILLPFTPKKSFIRLAKRAGNYTGKLGAAIGTRSTHYVQTTGH
ncbi:glycosyl transferase [Celeribacter naphthalenivorans]|uniref:glycosyl transferase n=1 Tax=Celeribacter naphthalenivorans TaxID=1614694 RepID=UPI001CFA5797|nr:glycosyl transferase [Celeribacter naphthalenivorans]